MTPSVETCCSLIASRSADWVRGEARLISSARSTFAKIGPSLKLKVPSRWLKTAEPRMSAGSRSGVNCTRRKSPEKQRARALASVVLPTPGTSSMRRCCPARRATRTWSSTSSLPRMTRASWPFTAWSFSAVAVVMASPSRR